MVSKTIQEITKDDHTCLIYSSNLEFLHCLIPFVREGFKRNRKTLIVLDEIKREDILRSLKHIYREGPISAEDLMPHGKLVIEQFKNLYLPDNAFNMERTMEYYFNSTKKAMEEGYSGLRVFAEVSSSAKDIINIPIFMEWEEYADRYFKDSNFEAVCAYNKKYLSEEDLIKVQSIHPITIDLIRTRL